MRTLALLVMVILPLQGIVGAMAAIRAPAHYHLADNLPAVLAHLADAPYPGDARIVQSDHDGHQAHAEHGHNEDAAPPGEHSHHHDDVAPAHHENHDDDNPVSTAAQFEHQQHGHVAVEANVRDTSIGRHAHGFTQTDVVYLADDPDRADLGSAGKHAGGSGEAALPCWSMQSMRIAGAQALPDGVDRFVSREIEPLLRPPSARGFALA